VPEHSRRSRAVRRFLGAGEAGQAHGAGGSKIASSISLQMISRVLGIVAGLVTLPLLARTLGADGYGIWTAALGFVGLFAAFTEFGLANAAMQRMAADPENEGQWLAAASSLRTLIGGALTVLCIVLIPIVFGTHGDAPWVALILVTTILSSGAVALMSVFKSRLQMGIPLLLSIVQNVLWIAAVAVIALTDASVEAVAVACAAILAFVAILQVIAVRTNIEFRFSGAREWWPGLLQIALPVGLGGIFVTIYYQLDAVLLFHIAGADETGVYGVAYRFFNSVVLIPGVVMGAFMPVIAAHYGKDNNRVRDLVQRAFDLMAVISLPGLAVALVLSGEIIAVFAGPGFDGAQTVLPILMAAFIPICLGNIAGFIAPVVGLRWRITAYAGVGAVANVALNLILIPSHGAVGAAWATLITEVVTMTLLFITCLHRLEFTPSLLRWLGTILAAALMAGAMLLVRPLGLVPALIVGGVVYAAALWILRVVTPQDIATLRPGRTP
jgi:O-antigen/teichoic acid export membrane protein